MIRGHAAMAVALALAGGFPALGNSVHLLRRPSGPAIGWVPPPSRRSRGFERRARIAAPGHLLRHGFVGNTPPCGAPAGYFWKRDIAGPHWRLYRQCFHTSKPGTARDRGDGVLVVTSSWGYVKPRYLRPEQLEAERSLVWG